VRENYEMIAFDPEGDLLEIERFKKSTPWFVLQCKILIVINYTEKYGLNVTRHYPAKVVIDTMNEGKRKTFLFSEPEMSLLSVKCIKSNWPPMVGYKIDVLENLK